MAEQCTLGHEGVGHTIPGLAWKGHAECAEVVGSGSVRGAQEDVETSCGKTTEAAALEFRARVRMSRLADTSEKRAGDEQIRKAFFFPIHTLSGCGDYLTGTG